MAAPAPKPAGEAAARAQRSPSVQPGGAAKRAKTGQPAGQLAGQPAAAAGQGSLARVPPNESPAPDEILLPVSEGDEIMIGRDKTKVDVHLDSTTLPNFISRTHGVLRREANGVVSLRDNGTQNGTFVNGVRITKVDLASGDLIAFGAKGAIPVGKRLGPGMKPPFQSRVQLD